MFCLILLFLAALSIAPPLSAAEPAFVEARVADASDRSYESTAIWLMDRAQTSIILSLFLVRPADHPRHPVDRLLQDLMEARARGVEVTLYLNTKIRGVAPSEITEAPWVARLTAAGVRVVPFASTRMLHDKLLIVDGRYVLEGSANWTVGALKSNWESNTVIESGALAQAKLERLSRLVHHQTAEDLGDGLGMPEDWDDTAVRRQVIKVLQKLAQRYGALEVQWTHGADGWVTLTAWSGPALAVPTALLHQAASPQERSAVSYLRLLRLQLAGQGIALEELPIEDLVAVTGLRPDRLEALAERSKRALFADELRAGFKTFVSAARPDADLRLRCRSSTYRPSGYAFVAPPRLGTASGLSRRNQVLKPALNGTLREYTDVDEWYSDAPGAAGPTSGVPAPAGAAQAGGAAPHLVADSAAGPAAPRLPRCLQDLPLRPRIAGPAANLPAAVSGGDRPRPPNQTALHLHLPD